MKVCLKGLHSYQGRQCNECHTLWRAANIERLTLNKQVYDTQNRALQSEQRRQRRAANPEKYKLMDKVSRIARRSKRTALEVKRQKSKINRTPKWLTKQHFTQMELFYDAASKLTLEFGFRIDVDHIIPLQGKLVSGLHVPWNLQLLPHTENMAKGNR